MSVFDRITRTVGDLDSPFYAEERQRDVWNEATAVGLQVMLGCGLALAAAMAWFGSPDVVPWAVGVLGVVGAGGCTVTAVANRRGVSGWEGVTGRHVLPRLVVFGVLFAVTVILLLTRLPGGDGFVAGMRAGVGVGVALAVAAAVAGLARHRRGRES